MYKAVAPTNPEAAVPAPQEPVTPAVPDAPVTPAVPDPGTPGAPEEPARVPTPEEPVTPAVPEPAPDEPNPGQEPAPGYSEAIPPECEVPLSAPPDDAYTYVIEEGTLGALRDAARHHGRDAGFGRELVEDLQVVTNELATNALCHGAPKRRLTIWGTSEEMICQVESDGAISDPLAGRRNPQPLAQHGMGLWIVHQLSDLVEIRDGTRTTVRAHLVA